MDPKHSIGPDRIDYQETPGDLTEVHAAIEREHPEPTADVTPIPMWLTAVCGFAIAAAGVYLGMFHGGFRGDVFNERASSPDLLFPQVSTAKNANTPIGPKTLAEQGKAVYSSICQACHQANGGGVPGTFPPLAKSEWVAGSEKRLVAIILKGLQGPITVEGKQYNNVMPPQGDALSDEKIAAVASYVRANFGNSAPEITAAKVAAARAEFASHTGAFTEADLKAIPEDATLPGGNAPSGADPAAGGAKGAGGTGGGASAPPHTPQMGAGSPAKPAAGGGPAPTTTPAGATPAAPAGAAAAPAPAAGGAAAAPSPDQVQKLMAVGKMQYMSICVACHQPNGMGLPAVFPPLAKTEYVNGSPERFAAMVLKGNMGPIKVNGAQFNNVMPGQEALLSDDKIAAVLTYVRASFGNTSPAVTPDVVAAARKKYADRKTPWTEAELQAWK
jgi:mono/diheme cytochrome c family protein